MIYQVYVRSFADADGDGIGDLAGIRSRLPYIADLGVDAIWLNPFYPSPQADAGYDVADYRDVDPRSARSPTSTRCVADAHGLGLRVIVDLVPNHTSSEHPWFLAALAAPPGSRERGPVRLPRRSRAGRRRAAQRLAQRLRRAGVDRVTEPDGTPGQWYLHLFAPEQPDLDWTNDEVRAEFESILRFWLDRGVDGFRIDVAHGLAKDPDMPDVAGGSADGAGAAAAGHPHWDQDEVHDVYRGWRRIDRLLRRRAGLRRRGLGRRRPSASPATSAPTSCTRPSTSSSSLRAVGRRRAARGDRPEHRRPRRGRGAADVGAVEPRRRPPRHPLRRRRAGRAPGPRRGAADAGPARRRLRLPGRGARPARGRPTCPTTLRQDPTFLRTGGAVSGPRRLPGAAAVVRRRPRRSASARPAAVAAPAGRVGRR